MMKKKTFYSFIQKERIKGAEKQSGFQIEKDGIKLYLYETDLGKVYIIDPDSGLSFFSDYMLLEEAETFLSSEKVGKIREYRERPEYMLRVEIFKKFKKAAKAYEKYSKIIDEMTQGAKNE